MYLNTNQKNLSKCCWTFLFDKYLLQELLLGKLPRLTTLLQTVSELRRRIIYPCSERQCKMSENNSLCKTKGKNLWMVAKCMKVNWDYTVWFGCQRNMTIYSKPIKAHKHLEGTSTLWISFTVKVMSHTLLRRYTRSFMPNSIRPIDMQCIYIW